MSLNLARLLDNYWKRQKISPYAGKFLGKVFRTGRVLTKGDLSSPIILNIVVDAVVREVFDVVCRSQKV